MRQILCMTLFSVIAAVYLAVPSQGYIVQPYQVLTINYVESFTYYYHPIKYFVSLNTEILIIRISTHKDGLLKSLANWMTTSAMTFPKMTPMKTTHYLLNFLRKWMNLPIDFVVFTQTLRTLMQKNSLVKSDLTKLEVLSYPALLLLIKV